MIAPPTRRLLALIRPYLGRLILASAIVSLAAAVGLIAPRVAGMVVDTVIDTAEVARSLHRLDLVVVALISLFALRGLLSFAETYILRATGARLLRDLRDRVYSHLVALGPDFYESRRLGELLSRIGSDLARVQATLTSQVPEGIRAGLTFAGTLAILFTMHAGLTLLALLMIPPIAVLSMWYGRRLRRLAMRVQDSLADTSADAEQALAGIRTVQACAGEELERRRYRGGLAELLRLQLRSARLVGVFLGVLQFVGFTAFSLILWQGGRLILRGELTPGELTAFLLYAFAIAGSIGSLGSLYAGVRELGGASARVFEILDTRASIVDGPAARPLERPRGEIELRAVSFRYPGEDRRDALREVSLKIRPGEVVAVVGPSGAGKSTLFGLLLRFRDPRSGAVTIDGSDLRDVTVRSARAAIALVPQEVFLFADSVAENIRYGAAGATDAEIEEAARAAGADEFIRELPAGYATLVGERGVKLSAGQRQRIAIARAFLRKAPILLLDEATSALDADSEDTVHRALAELMRDRTTLVIAHRLATARRADRIVVLEAGRVVAVGDHDELQRTSPLYRRYWELQALEAR